MNKFILNTESFPIRCEVCHQTDYFDPNISYCLRCKDLPTDNITDKHTINKSSSDKWLQNVWHTIRHIIDSLSLSGLFILCLQAPLSLFSFFYFSEYGNSYLHPIWINCVIIFSVFSPPIWAIFRRPKWLSKYLLILMLLSFYIIFWE